MKIIQIIILLFYSVCSYSQTVKYDTTAVVQVSKVTKDDLFNRANEWAINAFNSPNDVIDLADKNEGKILLKGSFPYVAPANSGGYTNTWNGQIYFSLKMYFKDERYKYELSIIGFISSAAPNEKPIIITKSKELPFYLKGKKGEILWYDLQKKCAEQLTLISNTLKEHISKKTQLEKNDW